MILDNMRCAHWILNKFLKFMGKIYYRDISREENHYIAIFYGEVRRQER